MEKRREKTEREEAETGSAGNRPNPESKACCHRYFCRACALLPVSCFFQNNYLCCCFFDPPLRARAYVRVCVRVRSGISTGCFFSTLSRYFRAALCLHLSGLTCPGNTLSSSSAELETVWRKERRREEDKSNRNGVKRKEEKREREGAERHLPGFSFLL